LALVLALTKIRGKRGEKEKKAAPSLPPGCRLRRKEGERKRMSVVLSSVLSIWMKEKRGKKNFVFLLRPKVEGEKEEKKKKGQGVYQILQSRSKKREGRREGESARRMYLTQIRHMKGKRKKRKEALGSSFKRHAR